MFTPGRAFGLVGIAVGLVVVGPALAPGSLLNLDLVVTSETPVPAGVWGLGPELPRRVPYFVPMAWLSTLLDGALVAKLVMVGAIAGAFGGVVRLCRDQPPVARVAAGLIYAAGPFLATRLAVGHFGPALAAAVLPWALPTLVRPGDSLRRTLLWSAALGLTGINGGLLAGLAVAVGLVADRGRRARPVAGVALIGQLPWLLPGVVVLAQGVDPSGADAFTTTLDGPSGLLRLAGGQGFWLPQFEVGEGSVLVPLAALVLVVAAVMGHRTLDRRWAGRAAALAVVGLVIAAGSAVWGLDGVYLALADTPVGAPLREGHRVLALFLVWLAPAATGGLSSRAREPRVGALTSLAVALILVGPALWGFGGRVEPVELPPEWRAARAAVRADPGPVLPLPWSQYLRPLVIDGRLVHHPTPFHLGGDVLLASGSGAVDVPDERADPREEAARGLVAAIDDEADIAAAAAPIGVRWLLVVATAENDYAALSEDPDLQPVVEGETLSLFRVLGAPSATEDRDGSAVAVDSVIGPFARVSDADAFTWFRPGADGWMRGWDAARVTAAGNLGFDDGGGFVWYWPTLLVLAGYGVVIGSIGWAFGPWSRRHPVLPFASTRTNAGTDLVAEGEQQ